MNKLSLHILVSILLLTLLSYSAFGQTKILHYTETTGWDHLTRTASATFFQTIATNMGYTLVSDNIGTEFNTALNLDQYAIVIFSNTSGSSGLTAAQRSNFEQYIQNGGSYLGIHAASDTYRHSTANGSSGLWDWYAETVAGCSVQEGPNHTNVGHNASMTLMNSGTGLETSLPTPWAKGEEWYYWESGYISPNFTQLFQVGQTGPMSYDTPRMAAHYRVLPGGGKAFYTSLGHLPSDFSGDLQFQQLLSNAVTWITAATLPVEWLYVDARGISGSKVELNWQTGSEEGNLFFGIERSLRGEIWDEIGEIPGAVSSNEPADYQFIDGSPLAGTSYYRIKQTDLDGAFSYSKTMEVERATFQIDQLRLYPNPVTEKLYLDGNVAGSEAIQVLNTVGQQVNAGIPDYSPNSSTPRLVADFSGLPTGLYFIKIGDQMRKVYKQ